MIGASEADTCSVQLLWFGDCCTARQLSCFHFGCVGLRIDVQSGAGPTSEIGGGKQYRWAGRPLGIYVACRASHFVMVPVQMTSSIKYPLRFFVRSRVTRLFVNSFQSRTGTVHAQLSYVYNHARKRLTVPYWGHRLCTFTFHYCGPFFWPELRIFPLDRYNLS